MVSKKKVALVWKIMTGLFVTAIAVMLLFRVYEWWLERRAHFIRYEAFGIDVPTRYTIHGVDVSRYQEIIDWASVQSMDVEGIKPGFCFIKATEGLESEDPRFKRNWVKSKQAGMVRGAYHFFIPSRSGKAQAEHFIKTVELQPGDLPPVLDVEQTNGLASKKVRERAKEWLVTVENYYGVKPIIYANVDFYQQILKDEFDEYPLWVAHYLQKEKPRIYRPWHFWQYSEKAHVNGIFCKVDFNAFYGDSADFKNLLIH